MSPFGRPLPPPKVGDVLCERPLVVLVPTYMHVHLSNIEANKQFTSSKVSWECIVLILWCGKENSNI